MTNNDDEIEERPTTGISSDGTPSVSRAQSNYSTQRTKLTIAPIKYGETRAEYLWRLLRSSIRRTIDAVTRADDVDIERSHGLHFIRLLNQDVTVKCATLNVKLKEIISVDQKNVVRIYHSDGRLKNKFKMSVQFDQLFYCTKEDEFIGWSQWKRELHIFSSELEILSTSLCDYLIGALTYNEATSDVFTCGRGGVTVRFQQVQVWQFRYNRKHLMPRFECHEGIKADLEYVLLAAEQCSSSIQRLFVTAGYDILCFNVADESRLISTKQDLHVRAMVAILFVEERDVLVTAGRDGSIKVWDNRWFIVHAFVGHHDRVLSIYKHPFGQNIISTSQDRTVRVWSLEYGDVVDVVKVSEPLLYLNVTRNYEKFLAVSNKCLQLWCIKHYCDFLTYIGSPVLKIKCTSHPDYPKRATLLCKDSTIRIVACESGNVLTSLVCDLNYKIIASAYAVGENVLFASNGSTLIKAETSMNPCKIIDEFQFNEYSINCLLIYEYVAKSQMDETPMLKSLVTKPSSDLIHLGLKGFSRTLLIAGFSNGMVAVLKWKTGEIDFSMDMHSSRPVVDMIGNPSGDQMITCGVDLIVRIWRVYPYSTESLAVVRSIFCAMPPVHLGIVKNFLSVGFRDEPTLTHSLMLYNLESNERFDHIPSADHGDRITGISGCSRLKLTATASFDGTIRIWNGRNQLIRMIIIHDVINSIDFSNDEGDLLIGIGDHLYKMEHNAYLPKSIVFKMISMEFKPTVDEQIQSEQFDEEQVKRLQSADFVRFKRARKAEKTVVNVVPENVDLTNFHAQLVEQNKLKNEELEKLEKRDAEIMQIAEGKIQRTKKVKSSNKIREEAFNEYMKMFLKERKKGLIDDENYQLTEEQLFGPLPSKSEPFFVEQTDQAFFPSLKQAKNDPLENYYKDRKQRLTKLDEFYREQPPFAFDDFRSIKENHEKFELKKLLAANVEKITLPSDRPRYGPGAIVPNSVLAKLLWPNREPPKVEHEEWKPPTLSAKQLEALEKNTPIDEDEAWNALMNEAKKKVEPTEEEVDDPFKNLKNKRKSEFMKQLTDLAQTPPKTPQPTIEIADESERQENEGSGPPTSKPPSRAARQTPLRNPIIAKIPPTPVKTTRIPVKSLPIVTDESSQTFTERKKTPRQFSGSFNRLIETLKQINWFEDQYPLVKIDIFLDGIDETEFPLEVLQRIDLIEDLENRLRIVKALNEFYRSETIDEQTREKLNEKLIFLLGKYDPTNLTSIENEFVQAYLDFLVFVNRLTIDVVAELIYWYLDAGEQMRPKIKHVFDECGLEDPFSHFYTEMDSWKLWELDLTQSRRTGIKTLAYEWLRQWTRSFRSHIEEMSMRLKSGDIHVQISKATSRVLTGDVSLTNRTSTNGKNLTVTLESLPRTLTKTISSIEVINYFVEITQEQINERNQPKDRPEDNTILVLPKINRPAALVRLGESNTVFHRPIRRNPLLLPYEHRFEPGELHLGRCVNYPVRKIALDPFRRQIFTEDIDFEDEPPYLLTLKLAPKYFLPILSQVTKI